MKIKNYLKKKKSAINYWYCIMCLSGLFPLYVFEILYNKSFTQKRKNKSIDSPAEIKFRKSLKFKYIHAGNTGGKTLGKSIPNSEQLFPMKKSNSCQGNNILRTLN